MLEGERNRLQPQSAQPHKEQLYIEGDRGRIDVLLTELYNREPGSYGCPARLLNRSYNLTVD